MSFINIERWYRELQATIFKYGVFKEGFWNLDEMGFRVGVGRGQWVITSVESEEKGKFAHAVRQEVHVELEKQLSSRKHRYLDIWTRISW